MAEPERKALRMDILIPIVIIGAWILMMAVVLPRMGVPT